jgi:Tol biopolymer transport system component
MLLMTAVTISYDGSDVQPRTFTKDMNWCPYPTPDGRHFVYVGVFEDNNWEVVLNDLAGWVPDPDIAAFASKPGPAN